MGVEVVTKYAWNGEFHMDSVAHNAAGRVSDFSGAGFGERDLGWVCKNSWEAQKIKRALDKIGLKAEIRERPA
jgi:hypothetical protein